MQTEPSSDTLVYSLQTIHSGHPRPVRRLLVPTTTSRNHAPLLGILRRVRGSEGVSSKSQLCSLIVDMVRFGYNVINQNKLQTGCVYYVSISEKYWSEQHIEAFNKELKFF